MFNCWTHDVSAELGMTAAVWYLVHTKPASESLAEAHLVRQGYHVYYARALETAWAGGRRRERVVALFPRYLFVQVDGGQQPVGPVRSTVGVTAIVRFGAEYAAVPGSLIANLRDRADPTTGLHRIDQPTLEPGAPVRIVAGAFEGLDGIFQRPSGEERVVVLLRLLGEETPVQVRTSYVMPHRVHSVGRL